LFDTEAIGTRGKVRFRESIERFILDDEETSTPCFSSQRYGIRTLYKDIGDIALSDETGATDDAYFENLNIGVREARAWCEEDTLIYQRLR